MKKEIRPQQAWIIHGFRGKPQQMEQLINQGFLLSFGAHFNEESLRLIPKDKFFLETDETTLSIIEIYQRVLNYIDYTQESLINQLEKNFAQRFN